MCRKEGEPLKVNIIANTQAKGIRVDILCPAVSPEVEKIAAALRMLEKELTGKKEGQIFFIPAREVIYIETVERKCFFYTKENYYETDFKLYELEQQLSDSNFIRAGKSILVNLKKVVSIKAELNRKLRITLESGEQIMASRQYAEGIKRKLGVK